MSRKISLYAISQAETLSPDVYSFFERIATDNRRLRAKNFIRREDSCRALIAEALIRLVYLKETGSVVDEAVFTCNEFGKPALKHSPIHFNVSHSGEWVVCGFDTNEIGVDIEKHHTVNWTIARRFYSIAENARLAQCQSDDLRDKAFFDIGVSKESYIKAIGIGLRCPLASFSCIPGTDVRHVAFCSDDDSLPAKNFRLLKIDPGYSCAVCFGDPATEIETKVYNPQQLKESLKRL